MKTADLTGPKLDYWVAKAEGHKPRIIRVLTPPNYEAAVCQVWRDEHRLYVDYQPSTEWSIAGLIIESAGIELTLHSDPNEQLGEDRPMLWAGHSHTHSSEESPGGIGATPLIAAMRAYVDDFFGEEVSDE